MDRRLVVTFVGFLIVLLGTVVVAYLVIHGNSHRIDEGGAALATTYSALSVASRFA